MKKFIFKILLFLSIIIIADFFIGKIISYLRGHANSGETERIYHIQNNLDEEILIFGSSRALDHYFPTIIEQELNMSCYNCGEDAHGIIYFYTLIDVIKKHYLPKIVIYDLYVHDIFVSDNSSQLTLLKPLWGESCVDSVIQKYDGTMKYKMLSQMYKYNSMTYDVLVDNIRQSNLYYKGAYVILGGEMSEEQIKKPTLTSPKAKIDNEKLLHLKRFIEANKDKTKLVFAISPHYGAASSKEFKPLFDIVDKYKIPLLNHYCDTSFTNHRDYFTNPNHMNCKGAKEYTKRICEEVLLKAV